MKDTEMKEVLIGLFLLEGNEYKTEDCVYRGEHSSSTVVGDVRILVSKLKGCLWIQAILESGRLVDYNLHGKEYKDLYEHVEKTLRDKEALELDEFLGWGESLLKLRTLKTN